MNVDIKQWPFAIGTAVGAAGAAVALAAIAGLGLGIGSPLALIAGAAAGGAGAWLGSSAFARRVVDALAAPVDGGIEAHRYVVGHAEIDELIGSMKQSLSNLRRLQLEGS